MKNKSLLLLILLLVNSSICFSYTWENFGPTGYECNNFVLWGGGTYHEIICTSTGILVNMGGNVWNDYSYSDLPCWDAEQVFMASADLIVTMGCGTFSDGIYFFNFTTFEFFISEWFLNPRFIYHCWNDDQFYVGGEQGLMKAEIPSIWESVDFFNGKYCYDMVSSYDNYIISTNEGIFYSNDAGQNWYPSNTIVNLCDLEMGSNGSVYGIFPDMSWSSGLWSSSDYGVNWDVEFWDVMLSSVSFDEQGSLFIGWEEPNEINQGVAQYFPLTSNFSLMNDGLPDEYVNKLTFHPFLIYPNIICCTDDGTYMLSDYGGTESNEAIIPNQVLEMSNFPNPFNPETMINYQLPEDSYVKLNIYNIKGQLVKILVNETKPAGVHSVIWESKDNKQQPVPSGIYFCRLKTKDDSKIKKMILLR